MIIKQKRPPRACDSQKWRQSGFSETFKPSGGATHWRDRKPGLIGISRPRRWQKQLLMNLLLSPQLAMDVRDEEPLCSSSATEAAVWPPRGRRLKLIPWNFRNASKNCQEIMEAVPCMAPTPFTACLALSLYFSFSSPKSFSLAFPHITRFPLAPWPYIHWRFENHREAATSFLFLSCWLCLPYSR